jgi:hypothetical protein
MEAEVQSITSQALAFTAQGVAYAMTLLGMWCSGRKSLWGPMLGLAGCVPWSIIGITSGTYSLLPFNLIIAALYVRTIILWRRDAKS